MVVFVSDAIQDSGFLSFHRGLPEVVYSFYFSLYFNHVYENLNWHKCQKHVDEIGCAFYVCVCDLR